MHKNTYNNILCTGEVIASCPYNVIHHSHPHFLLYYNLFYSYGVRRGKLIKYRNIKNKVPEWFIFPIIPYTTEELIKLLTEKKLNNSF
jgi:hypothetical protein